MPVVVPLTSLSHGAGCGCKLPAAAIGSLLSSLPAVEPDPAVIVTANPGCLLQLQSGLAERGSRVQVKHLAEVLDAASAP